MVNLVANQVASRDPPRRPVEVLPVAVLPEVEAAREEEAILRKRHPATIPMTEPTAVACAITRTLTTDSIPMAFLATTMSKNIVMERA